MKEKNNKIWKNEKNLEFFALFCVFYAFFTCFLRVFYAFFTRFFWRFFRVFFVFFFVVAFPSALGPVLFLCFSCFSAICIGILFRICSPLILGCAPVFCLRFRLVLIVTLQFAVWTANLPRAGHFLYFHDV